MSVTLVGPGGEIELVEGATVVPVEPELYYATAQGGRCCFNVTTGLVEIEAAGEYPVALLSNPADSGVDAYLGKAEFGCSASTVFSRRRVASMELTGLPMRSGNKGGGTLQAETGLYTPDAFTAVGGDATKTAHIDAYAKYETRISSILRPGRNVMWTVVGPGGIGAPITVAIYLEWWELPADE